MDNTIPSLSKKAVDLTLPLYRFKAKIDNAYSFLSNFYPGVKNYTKDSPQPTNQNYLFEVNGQEFNSAEQYYQYMKFLVIDVSYANQVVMDPTLTPADVKKVSGKGYYINYKYKKGNGITKASLTRTFDDNKKLFITEESLSTMREALYHKFTQNSQLKNALVDTYPHPLSEIGRMKRDYWAHTGQDMLGKLLLELRFQFITDVVAAVAV